MYLHFSIWIFLFYNLRYLLVGRKITFNIKSNLWTITLISWRINLRIIIIKSLFWSLIFRITIWMIDIHRFLDKICIAYQLFFLALPFWYRHSEIIFNTVRLRKLLIKTVSMLYLDLRLIFVPRINFIVSFVYSRFRL